MQSFKELATMTPRELAFLEAPTGIAQAVASGQSATAAAIIKAAATARAGGPSAPKPSTVAQQILDAGKKRRAEV
jgi:hypothetical protein